MHRLTLLVDFVFSAYDTSKLYREVRLRAALLENNSLKLLPKEQLYNKVSFVLQLLCISNCFTHVDQWSDEPV